MNHRTLSLIAIACLLIASPALAGTTQSTTDYGEILNADSALDFQQSGDVQNSVDYGGAGVELVDNDPNGLDVGSWTSSFYSGDAVNSTVDLTLVDARATVRWYRINGTTETLEKETVVDAGSGGQDFTLSDNFSAPSDQVYVDIQLEEYLTQTGATAEVDTVTIGINPSTPTATNPDPNGDRVREGPVDLSVDISDPDFELDASGNPIGDTVTVEWYHKGPADSSFSQIDSKDYGQNTTATTSLDSLDAGEHEWYVVLTDSFGEKWQSDTFTFDTPRQLILKNVSDPTTNVTTGSDVTVTFIADGVTETRTTTDGTVSMVGLPATDTYEVVVEAPGYETRTVRIESLFEQRRIYLLPTTADTRENVFTIEDRTGQYSDEVRLFIERPITINNETTYQRVASGTPSAAGEIPVTLEAGVRYRLYLENGRGDSRTLGFHTPQANRTIVLEVRALSFSLGDTDGIRYDAAYRNATGPEVSFNWTANNISVTTLDVTITRVNDSTTVFENSYTDPESIGITESVTAPQKYRIEWNATTLESSASGSQIVGPGINVSGLDAIDQRWLSIISIGALLLVTGLFGGVRAELGAVVMPMMAGTFWFVGFLPAEISGGVIVVGLLIGLLLFARGSGGGI